MWTDITVQYAGLFFRAEGGGADPFGTIQEENAPRVTEAIISHHDGHRLDEWNRVTLGVGAWSSGIGLYAGRWDEPIGNTHRFYTSGGEVRPKNMAIRVWKRTA